MEVNRPSVEVGSTGRGTVKGNLAPISYELTALTMLGSFMPNLNTTSAMVSFNSYLGNYSKTEKSSDVSPDRPTTRPLKVIFKKLEELHGRSMNQKIKHTQCKCKSWDEGFQSVDRSEEKWAQSNSS